jgi:hypothetical protein
MGIYKDLLNADYNSRYEVEMIRRRYGFGF